MSTSADVHLGMEKHTRVCLEQDWGVCPDSPDWHCLPVWGDGYGVRDRDVRYRPDTACGGWRGHVNLSRMKQPTGRWTMPLYPEAAGFVLDMALSRQSGRLSSYCIDLYAPHDSRRHTGCMVSRARLECGARNEPPLWHLWLAGREEQANADLSAGDFDYSQLATVPFRFHDAEIKIDGASTMMAEAFAVTVQNNVRTGPARLGRPAYLVAGNRQVSLELRKIADEIALSSAVREGRAVSFSAILAHPAGWALTIDLPVLHVEESAGTGGPGEPAVSSTRLQAGVDQDGVDLQYSVISP